MEKMVEPHTLLAYHQVWMFGGGAIARKHDEVICRLPIKTTSTPNSSPGKKF